MAKAIKIPERIRVPSEKLYIGAWMDFRGVQQSEVVEKTELNPGYISQLYHWQKMNKQTGKMEAPNPTVAVVEVIAHAIGIETRALYSPPPATSAPVKVSRSTIGALQDIKVSAGGFAGDKKSKRAPRTK